MNILVCIQHNFVMACGVMLKSLICHHQQDEIHIYAILNKDVDDNDKHNLTKIVEIDKTKRIEFYVFDKGKLDNYPGLNNTHFRESVYYRLFCSTILPKSLNKVIYLDSDIIVNDSLIPLWVYDMKDNAVCGIINPLINRKRLEKFLSKEDVYINSGVMVINLDYWRVNDVEKEFVDFIHDNHDWISIVDQDVLNAVLNGKIGILPLKFNVQHKFLYKDKFLKKMKVYNKEDLFDARNNPVIIHYTGPDKPWMKNCTHPLSPLFLEYQKSTIWKGVIMTNFTRVVGLKKWYYLFRDFLLHVTGRRDIPMFSYDKKICKCMVGKLCSSSE